MVWNTKPADLAATSKGKRIYGSQDCRRVLKSRRSWRVNRRQSGTVQEADLHRPERTHDHRNWFVSDDLHGLRRAGRVDRFAQLRPRSKGRSAPRESHSARAATVRCRARGKNFWDRRNAAVRPPLGPSAFWKFPNRCNSDLSRSSTWEYGVLLRRPWDGRPSVAAPCALERGQAKRDPALARSARGSDPPKRRRRCAPASASGFGAASCNSLGRVEAQRRRVPAHSKSNACSLSSGLLSNAVSVERSSASHRRVENGSWKLGSFVPLLSGTKRLAPLRTCFQTALPRGKHPTAYPVIARMRLPGLSSHHEI